jgi:hypothetical protein
LYQETVKNDIIMKYRVYTFIYSIRDVDNQRGVSTFGGKDVIQAEEALLRAFPLAFDIRVLSSYDTRSTIDQNDLDNGRLF